MSGGTPVARWTYGSVDLDADHFVLTHGQPGEPGRLVAYLGRDDVSFVVEILDSSDEVRDAVRKELYFYLVELDNPDRWEYAIYHCSTSSNLYSTVHWAYFPAGYHRNHGRD